MKFEIQKTDQIHQYTLSYVAEEYSFSMKPAVTSVDFEIAVNELTLTVLSWEVIQVEGYCPYQEWKSSYIQPPVYDKGHLKVKEQEINFSGAYDLTRDARWPTFVNIKQGWVCIGNPTQEGQAVEFNENCIATIDKGNLTTLWLKPNKLPFLR